MTVFRLERFYLYLLRDLVEILEVDPTPCFWEDEIYYEYRDYRESTQNQSCLRDHIDFYFERLNDDFECSFLFKQKKQINACRNFCSE